MPFITTAPSHCPPPADRCPVSGEGAHRPLGPPGRIQLRRQVRTHLGRLSILSIYLSLYLLTLLSFYGLVFFSFKLFISVFSSVRLIATFFNLFVLSVTDCTTTTTYPRSENSHPRLWRLLATASLEDMDLNMAERSFVRCVCVSERECVCVCVCECAEFREEYEHSNSPLSTHD